MRNKNEKKENNNPPAATEKSSVPVRASDNLVPFAGFTPFSLMRRFTDDMERMFDDFSNFRLSPFFERSFAFPSLTEVQMPVWSPQIEVTENNGQFTVRADLPGLKKEDIDVEVRDDALVISGQRKEESKEEREGFYRSERSYGSFYRSIPLPEGADKDKATATFQDGVLQVSVTVPARELKGRKLEITGEGEKSRAKSA